MVLTSNDAASHGPVPTMFPMTDGQYQVVYDILSFSLASMMASTIFFWLRVGSIHEKYKSALVITGLVTFIAAYHYIRIFNSWVDAYEYPKASDGITVAPVLTGIPFNDAYRYMDWLLTVPLLLIESVFVMNLTPSETFTKASRLGVASGLMIIIGYPGELVLQPSELGTRWLYWGMALCPFGYVVYELCIGLNDALQSEESQRVRDLIWWAQRGTVISWLTYPVVYIIPMFGARGAGAVVGIQMGYCISDIISKCGVGLLIYNVTVAKSQEAKYLDPESKKSYGTA
jgi:bacteriorhodopsin